MVQGGLTLRVHAIQRWLAAHLCDKFIYLLSPVLLFLDIIINHNTSHSQECEHAHHCPQHLATAFPMFFFFGRGVLGTRRDRRGRAFRL